MYIKSKEGQIRKPRSLGGVSTVGRLYVRIYVYKLLHVALREEQLRDTRTKIQESHGPFLSAISGG